MITPDTYISPKEIRQKLHRYTAKYRREGSRQRSEIHAVRCYLALDDRRHVRFNFSTGKFKTVQEPQGEPLLAHWSRLAGPQ